MSDTPAPAPIESLLAHREWVRALARTLVSDPSRADDLEQDAWLAALRRPPTDDRSPQGWLATVLRRAAGKGQRTSARALRRERVAARPEAEPATADVVAQAEAHGSVVRAVLALPEPLRRTVLLRYFEGLPADEVAAQTGATAVAVRSRVHRALGLLRERLDAEHGGDRSAWVATLAPLAAAPPGGFPPADQFPATAASVPTAAGVIAMSTKTKVALAALALLAAVVGATIWPAPWKDATGRAAAPGDLAAAPERVPAAPTLAKAPRAAAPAASRAAAATSGASDAPAGTKPADAAVAAADRWSVAGTVTSRPTKKGVAYAWVRLTLARGVLREPLGTLRCDAEGKFEAPLPALDALSDTARALSSVIAVAGGAGHRFEGDMGQMLAQQVSGPARRIVGNVVLVPGAVARGRVVGPDGTPAPGAQVALYVDGQSDSGYAEAGEDGRFEVGIPAAGPGFVLAHASGVGSAAILGRTWATTADSDLPDLLLEGGGWASGVVVREDGRPVPHVSVFAESADHPTGGAKEEAKGPRGNGWGSAETDAEGRFRVAGMAPGRIWLSAIASRGSPGAEPVEVPAATAGVRLVVHGSLLLLRVVDDAGQPLAGATYRVESRGEPSFPVRSGLTGEHPIEAVSMPSGAKALVVVTAEGCAPAEREVAAGSGPEPVEATIVVRRDGRPGRVRVEVAGPGGEAIDQGNATFRTAGSKTEVSAGNGDWSAKGEPPALPPGTYEMTFYPYGAHEDETDTMYLPVTSAVSVAAGEEARLSFHARRGGRVRVTLDLPEEPKYFQVESASAVPADGGTPIPIEGWARDHEDGSRSWTAGTVILKRGYMVWPLRPLPAGRYRIRMQLKGMAPAEVVVVIEEGKFAEATLRVVPK